MKTLCFMTAYYALAVFVWSSVIVTVCVVVISCLPVPFVHTHNLLIIISKSQFGPTIILDGPQLLNTIALYFL